jgi:hypothetical protein
MCTQTSRRLPGIRFEVQVPPLTDVLPRMDVAVFVGFAMSGPLHTPVAVEDVAHFTAIFGDDLPIAWNAQQGEIVYAYLASSVRAFFRNGGRRCWVIRVGDAAYNTFPVPHVMQILHPKQQTDQWTIRPSLIQATSPGSWSDTLQVNTSLLSEAVTIAAPTFKDNTITLALSSNFDIPEGSLLQVTYTKDKETTYKLYAVLENVQVTQAKTLGSSSQQFSAIAKAFSLFETVTPEEPDLTNPPLKDPPVLVDPISAADQLGTPDTHALILSFELWVKYPDGRLAHMSDLGFSAQHPRFWGALPTDEQIYRDTSRPTVNPYAVLWQEAMQQHFPLAFPPAKDSEASEQDLLLAEDSIEDIFYIPINMRPTVADNEFQGVDTSGSRPETPLDRDGLSILDEKLFLDRDLRDNVTTENLLAQADFISYQSSRLRPLEGIHAALYIDEATIIAVPDAVHLGWTSTLSRGKLPDPPAPTSPAPAVQAPPPTFHNCLVTDVTKKPVLKLQKSETQANSFTLSWDPVGTAEQTARYTLQEATVPNFADAVTIYIGSDTTQTLSRLSFHDYYYRVNAELKGSSISDWSDGVAVRIAPLQRQDKYDPQALSLVHTALLRFCCARGDTFAIMALPSHYREDDAIAYTADLKCNLIQLDRIKKIDANMLGYDEAGAFSFGALYHPWLIGRENSQLDELRQTPPDGAAAGIMARRALTRGAWVAPANEVLSNVVALTPALMREHWLDLQDAQLNIVRQEPRGFLSLSADTLSDDSELRPINVRRLLILLRRLALRLGADYVFEPNSPAFRRAVQRGFEALLEQLFIRGAFVGNTASEAFQVVTKSYLNTPQSIEQGRFIVELKVAPSQPLTFLTVRLLQSNDRGLVTEG